MKEPTKQTLKEVERRARQKDLDRIKRLTGNRHCPNCGKMVYPNDKHCPECYFIFS